MNFYGKVCVVCTPILTYSAGIDIAQDNVRWTTYVFILLAAQAIAFLITGVFDRKELKI